MMHDIPSLCWLRSVPFPSRGIMFNLPRDTSRPGLHSYRWKVQDIVDRNVQYRVYNWLYFPCWGIMFVLNIIFPSEHSVISQPPWHYLFQFNFRLQYLFQFNFRWHYLFHFFAYWKYDSLMPSRKNTENISVCQQFSFLYLYNSTSRVSCPLFTPCSVLRKKMQGTPLRGNRRLRQKERAGEKERERARERKVDERKR